MSIVGKIPKPKIRKIIEFKQWEKNIYWIGDIGMVEDNMIRICNEILYIWCLAEIQYKEQYLNRILNNINNQQTRCDIVARNEEVFRVFRVSFKLRLILEFRKDTKFIKSSFQRCPCKKNVLFNVIEKNFIWKF